MRLSRFTAVVTSLTLVAPLPIRVARAVLGSAPSSLPVFPMLLGMRTPCGASNRAVADGGWFITLSRMTSYRSRLCVKSCLV